MTSRDLERAPGPAVEDAIAGHLQVERTRATRVRDDYRPAYEACVARFAPAVSRVVCGYFGVQRPPGGDPDEAADALAGLLAALRREDGPTHAERAVCVDGQGCVDELVISYWRDPDRHDRWFDRDGRRWMRDADACRSTGRFMEVFRPTVQRVETVSSPTLCEGLARAADGMSGAVREHGYWGSMRDRLPAAQTGALAPGGRGEIVVDGALRRLRGRDNVCLVRSGQDWSGAAPDERAAYLERLEPLLRRGMAWLETDGASIGCLGSRYARLVADDGTPLDKSFGMSAWRGLADLERWAGGHGSHLDLFVEGARHLARFGAACAFRRHHEVAVVAASEMTIEYLNCPPHTGFQAAWPG